MPCTSGLMDFWGSFSNNGFIQRRHSVQASKMTPCPKEGRYLFVICLHIVCILSQPFLSGTGPPFSSQKEGKTSYCSLCEGGLSFPLLLMSSWLVTGGKHHLYFPAFCLCLFAGSQKATQRAGAVPRVRLGPGFTETWFGLMGFGLQPLWLASK